MVKGTVKWFNPMKNYGFIETAGKDLFFHGSEVQDKIELSEGDAVEFKTATGPKGEHAVDVKKIEDGKKEKKD